MSEPRRAEKKQSFERMLLRDKMLVAGAAFLGGAVVAILNVSRIPTPFSHAWLNTAVLVLAGVVSTVGAMGLLTAALWPFYRFTFRKLWARLWPEDYLHWRCSACKHESAEDDDECRRCGATFTAAVALVPVYAEKGLTFVLRSGMQGQFPLLEVRNLTKFFPIRRGLLSKTVGYVKAVHGISFAIRAGETLGLVGESGCGKTTTGRCLLRLIEPTSGSIIFRGTKLRGLSQSALRPFRREMQIIFQDPFSSLNPRMTVEQIIAEGLVVHGLARRTGERRARVLELLRDVGLPPEALERYPHEFSGGQRQRVGIARALAVKPAFIACDEPVSALDVSVQAQIINLLIDLQQRHGFSYLFIAHDLSVVEHISTRVAVMYLGHIVEYARTADLFGDPRHPYTRALLSAVPRRTPEEKKERQILGGEPPSPIDPPPGCPFAPRCPIVRPECSLALPELAQMGSPEHFVRCPYVR